MSVGRVLASLSSLSSWWARSRDHVPPVADWAVMRDPFGNEFCLIDQLSKEQRSQVLKAAERGVIGDHELRLAAGVTR